MIEVWKEIKGYEGQYEVSSFGMVKSLPRTKTCKDPYNGLRLLKIKGCIRKLRVFHGYHTITIRTDEHKVKHYFIHRLVAQAFIPNPENKPQVNHIDSNRLNNHVSNLEWATRSENQNHAGKKGRLTFNRNKLTLDQVIEIRNSPNITCLATAKKFGVTKGLVSKIRRRQIWKSW